MARIYGHRWVSSYGEEDDGTWLKGLRGLTPADLAVGLSACIEEAKEWPPSLPMFRRMCRKDKLPSIHQPYKALPMPLSYTRQRVSKIKRAIKETPKRYRAALTRILDNCVRRYSK